MRAILVGAGGVSRDLLRRLGEMWEVTLVDVSREKLSLAAQGRQAETVEGDGSSQLVLRRAGIDVVTAGLTDGLVTASRGVVLLPDSTLDQVLGDEFDMIVLPGGLPGADNLDADPRIHTLLQRMAEQDRYTAAICAAPVARD